jgi:uncharacterized protein
MDSPFFPTVALVREGRPMNPVRIYAGGKMDHEEDRLVVFISEFQPPPNLIKGIAATVLDWAQDQRCVQLVCPEGLIVDREAGESREVEVYGIGSTDRSNELLKKNGVAMFEEGVITGVAGVLLNEGRKRDFDVMTLLSEAHPDYPDARAAARVIETIDKLLLHTALDAKPLYEEAERIENQLKSIHHQTEGAKKPARERPPMYG